MKTYKIISITTTIEIISSLFILLFVYTALSKSLNYEAFKISIMESPITGRGNGILSRSMQISLGWLIISLELLISALLTFPKTRLIGLYGSLILMSLFTIYVGYILAFGTDIPCTCGGVLAQLSWPNHLIFNVVFTILAALSIFLYKKKELPNSKGNIKQARS